MKFSSLEQNVIIDLCSWAGAANEFKSARNFFSEVTLKDGTGLFVFSKEEVGRPSIILCIDIEKHDEKEYYCIHNDILFKLHFLRKLEQLGLVTISEGRYFEENEYAIASFKGIRIPCIRRCISDQWSYCFQFCPKGGKPIDAVLEENGLTIRNRTTGIALLYHTEEVFSKFDAFNLVSSNIALEQELFDLKEHGFKTIEERMLETSEMQLNKAECIILQAEKQTSLSLTSIKQAKTQFEKAQNKASAQFLAEQINSTKQFDRAQRESRHQFDIAQKESKRQFESANNKSFWALVLAVTSILASPFVAKYISTTIDEDQYHQIDSLQIEILNNLVEINNKDVDVKPDTTLNVIREQLDEISKTLKKVNYNLVTPSQK